MWRSKTSSWVCRVKPKKESSQCLNRCARLQNPWVFYFVCLSFVFLKHSRSGGWEGIPKVIGQRNGPPKVTSPLVRWRDREAGKNNVCPPLDTPATNPVLTAPVDAPRDSSPPTTILFPRCLISSAHTPTPGPCITKVNLLLKGIVCRVSIFSSFGVHLPEGVLREILDVASLF